LGFISGRARNENFSTRISHSWADFSRFFPKASEEMPRKGEDTRHGYGVGVHLALVVVFLGAVDAMPIDSEESAGLAAVAVDILLPLAASAAIAGAGALVAGSLTRGVAGQPAANRTHAELKNDLTKIGEIYVHTCGMCESDP
jgi:hypothetical protein